MDGKGLSTEAKLTIHVEDVNDNAPRFMELPAFSLPGNVSIASQIGRVLAVDADSSQDNNQVFYSIIDGSYGKFSIDFNEGEILLSFFSSTSSSAFSSSSSSSYSPRPPASFPLPPSSLSVFFIYSFPTFLPPSILVLLLIFLHLLLSLFLLHFLILLLNFLRPFI